MAIESRQCENYWINFATFSLMDKKKKTEDFKIDLPFGTCLRGNRTVPHAMGPWITCSRLRFATFFPANSFLKKILRIRRVYFLCFPFFRFWKIFDFCLSTYTKPGETKNGFFCSVSPLLSFNCFTFILIFFQFGLSSQFILIPFILSLFFSLSLLCWVVWTFILFQACFYILHFSEFCFL